MTPSLETPRLHLVPLSFATVEQDAAQVQRIFPQWDIVRHLNSAVPWPFPEDGVLHYYRDVALPAMARGNEWHWTLRLKSDLDGIIGAIGLMRSDTVDNPSQNNRGFWLDPRHHRQGLMTEAVIAINDYWFNVLGFDCLRSPKASENDASIRISQKTGMRLIETKVSAYVSGALPTQVWEITAAEWQAWRNR